ncbi:MAG: hypothetical protein ABF289_06720 [Clostridiales bacterium]
MDSYILEVLIDEKERAIRMINTYEKEIDNLPKGTISIKNINEKSYNYLIYRKNGKKVSDYIKTDELDEIKKQLDKRNKLINVVNRLKIDLKIMNNAISYGNKLISTK